jgi:hypothetical protein
MTATRSSGMGTFTAGFFCHAHHAHNAHHTSTCDRTLCGVREEGGWGKGSGGRNRQEWPGLARWTDSGTHHVPPAVPVLGHVQGWHRVALVGQVVGVAVRKAINELVRVHLVWQQEGVCV